MGKAGNQKRRDRAKSWLCWRTRYQTSYLIPISAKEREPNKKNSEPKGLAHMSKLVSQTSRLRPFLFRLLSPPAFSSSLFNISNNNSNNNNPSPADTRPSVSQINPSTSKPLCCNSKQPSSPTGQQRLTSTHHTPHNTVQQISLPSSCSLFQIRTE